MSGSFWRYNSYGPVSTIDSLLEKPDCSLEELLDDPEILQQLMASNAKLIEFLCNDAVMAQLIEYLLEDQRIQNEGYSKGEQESSSGEKNDMAEGNSKAVEKDEKDDSKEEEDESEHIMNDTNTEGLDSWHQDNSFDFCEDEEEQEETPEEIHSRRTQVSTEILSSDAWSIVDALMENTDLLNSLWGVLDLQTPLPSTTATYFMKINEQLLDMKTDEIITFILQQPNFVERFMKHIDNTPLMDFLLKVISTDKPNCSTGIIDMLYEQNLISSLIEFLGPDVQSTKQSAAGDFLKAFITISANSNTDSSTIGPNDLTRQLVSEPVIGRLVELMLHGGTGLANGVGILIEIIRKNNSDYDFVSVLYTTIETHPPNSRDPIYLGHLVKVFSKAIPTFTEMLKEKSEKVLETPFGTIEPLGFERFKICELIAELLHCSNMALLNDKKGAIIVQERDEVRAQLRANSHLNDDLQEDGIDQEIDEIKNLTLSERNQSQISLNDQNVDESDTEEPEQRENTFDENEYENGNGQKTSPNVDNDEVIEITDASKRKANLKKENVVGDELKIALYDNEVIKTILEMFFKFPWNNFLHNVVFDIVQQLLTGSMTVGYNEFLVRDLFDRSAITELILAGQRRCDEYEEESGLRLGYMGHLTLIAEEVVKFCRSYESNLDEVIEKAVSTEDWLNYVKCTLSDIRKKYNSILGGDMDIEGEDTQDFSENFVMEEGELSMDHQFQIESETSEGQNADQDAPKPSNPDSNLMFNTGWINDMDDYEDPNDDGQSYAKPDNPLYETGNVETQQLDDGFLDEKGLDSDEDSGSSDEGESYDDDVDVLKLYRTESLH
ncbi:BA75_04790T0 [Komagataella pastoris]|uniref:BA75_04790T0 n=1 Tax=Komagataella pastoris TaxID=4922 RepID=A0A1B2JHR3_PICPA|nr:BA75_04790T0 [Komagataella pastoris]